MLHAQTLFSLVAEALLIGLDVIVYAELEETLCYSGVLNLLEVNL